MSRSRPAQIFKILTGSILECLNLSSVHGIPKIVKSGQLTPLRFLWLFCFVCSATYCVYMVFNLMRNYLNYSVATSIQEIEERPIQFPMVVVCDFNSFNTEWGFALTQDYDSVNTIDGIWSENLILNSWIQNGFPKNVIVNPFSLDIKDMLISCMISLKKCSWQDFEPVFDNRYGNCYKFNSGKYYNGSTATIQTVSSEGNLLGLQLELFVGLDNGENELSWGNGAVILIANQTSYSTMNEFGLFLPTGQTTQLQIKKSIKSKLGPPYSSCLLDTRSKDAFDSKSYRKTLEVTEVYDATLCFTIAYQYALLELCGCQDYAVFHVQNDIFCAYSGCYFDIR